MLTKQVRKTCQQNMSTKYANETCQQSMLTKHVNRTYFVHTLTVSRLDSFGTIYSSVDFIVISYQPTNRISICKFNNVEIDSSTNAEV